MYSIFNIGSNNEVTRYSSEEISGNESGEVMSMTETERQADFNRHKEEMKKKRRKKKRTSSSLQSSTFQGKWFFRFSFKKNLYDLIIEKYIPHEPSICYFII